MYQLNQRLKTVSIFMQNKVKDLISSQYKQKILFIHY